MAELEMRQAAKADELRDLRDREMAAPAADADRLATWQLNEEEGPRPEPELPAIREQIQQRQEEWEALTRATARVLADKTAFVEKHRGRLVREADGYADEAHRRYLELVDQLADARADLFAKRSAAVWARLYPGELAGRGPADTFAGGLRRPLQAMGLDTLIAPTGYSTDSALTPTTCARLQPPSRSSPSRAVTRAPRPTPSGTTAKRASSGSATNANGRYSASTTRNDGFLPRDGATGPGP